MTTKKRLELEQLKKTLAHWDETDKEHKEYRKAHPDKPLTPTEVKWLEDYQRLTHDPRWWH